MKDEKKVPPPTLKYLRPDGAKVSIEYVFCMDCDFLSGIVRVEWPDRVGIQITGAGCKAEPRRGPKEAKALADSLEHP